MSAVYGALDELSQRRLNEWHVAGVHRVDVFWIQINPMYAKPLISENDGGGKSDITQTNHAYVGFSHTCLLSVREQHSINGAHDLNIVVQCVGGGVPVCAHA